MLAETGPRHLLDILAIDQDPAAVRLVKTCKQINDRSLTGPSGTYKRDGLPFFCMETNIIYRLALIIVRKGNILKVHLTTYIPKFRGLFLIHFFFFFIKYGETRSAPATAERSVLN